MQIQYGMRNTLFECRGVNLYMVLWNRYEWFYKTLKIISEIRMGLRNIQTTINCFDMIDARKILQAAY